MSALKNVRRGWSGAEDIRYELDCNVAQVPEGRFAIVPFLLIPALLRAFLVQPVKAGPSPPSISSTRQARARDRRASPVVRLTEGRQSDRSLAVPNLAACSDTKRQVTQFAFRVCATSNSQRAGWSSAPNGGAGHDMPFPAVRSRQGEESLALEWDPLP